MGRQAVSGVWKLRRIEAGSCRTSSACGSCRSARKNGIHISRRRLRRPGEKHEELKGVDGVVYVIVTRAGLWRRGERERDQS